MTVANTHKYIPRIEQREENLFVEEYYSSTDTQIYFDDIKQTEISYINYSIQEQLKPLYGYASRTFDDVSVGNRIVTGSFKVPISNPELQTQPEDFNKYKEYDFSGSPDIDDTEEHNKKEEDETSSKEWTHPDTHPKDENESKKDKTDTSETDPVPGPAPATGPTVTTKPDTDDASERAEYSEKLDAIFEYDNPNSTKYMTSLKEKIAAFQIMIGEKADGKLIEDIKKKIDKAYEDRKNYNGYILWIGTKVYVGPNVDWEYTVVEKRERVTVISVLKDWICIRLENGRFGYIQRGELRKDGESKHD